MTWLLTLRIQESPTVPWDTGRSTRFISALPLSHDPEQLANPMLRNWHLSRETLLPHSSPLQAGARAESHGIAAAVSAAAGSQRPALEEAGPRSKTCTLLLFSGTNWLPKIPTWEIEISEVAFHLSSS